MALTLIEFESLAGSLYDDLPDDIQSKFALYIVEKAPDHLKNAFGYHLSMFPNAITLNYEAFLNHGDFSEAHISRVIKHEVEHVLLNGLRVKHSEHIDN